MLRSIPLPSVNADFSTWLMAARTAPTARSSSLRGRRAERVALDYLVADGFEILHRNVRLGRGELDLVARRGALLVAVEVRTRGPHAWEGPFASVSVGKRRRCRSALEALWRRHTDDPTIRRVRFDVCAVYLDESPVRVEVAEGVSLR